MPKRIALTSESASSGSLKNLEWRREQVYCLRDSLDYGRLVDFESAEDWFDERIAWREANDHGVDVAFWRPPAERSRAIPDAIDGAEEVVVWVGNTLADELFVAWLARLLEVEELRADAMILRQLPGPEREDYKDLTGLGGVAPEAYEDVPSQVLDDDTLSAAADAWRAATSEDPSRIADRVAARESAPGFEYSVPATVDDTDDTDGVRWPGVRIGDLVGHYPSTSSGLDVWEAAMLRNLEQGDSTLRAMGRAIEQRVGGIEWPENVDQVDRLLSLSDERTDAPLIRMTGSRDELSELDFEVTDLGRAALAGEADRVETCGLDRWVGGVHLDSEAPDSLWWRTEDGLAPIRT